MVKDLNDLKAIKDAYENNIRVNSTGDYIRFELNNNASNNISLNNGSFGLNFIINDIERSFRFVDENENSNKSLQSQLNELNEHSNIEWKIDGEKVIPESLKTSKLSKSKFKNEIKFDKVKKRTPKTVLDKNYSFEFKDGNAIIYNLYSRRS